MRVEGDGEFMGSNKDRPKIVRIDLSVLDSR